MIVIPPVLTLILTEDLTDQQCEWLSLQNGAVVDLSCIRESLDTLYCLDPAVHPYHDELVTGVEFNPFRIAHYMVTTLFESGNTHVILIDDITPQSSCVDTVWWPYCREHDIQLDVLEDDGTRSVFCESAS
ncbi:MAG: hypothetical protein ACR2HF_00015 [Methylococcaceae bacterium]